MSLLVLARMTDEERATWLQGEFEYERCYLCGEDWPEHELRPGPFGEPHIICLKEETE